MLTELYRFRGSQLLLPTKDSIQDVLLLYRCSANPEIPKSIWNVQDRYFRSTICHGLALLRIVQLRLLRCSFRFTGSALHQSVSFLGHHFPSNWLCQGLPHGGSRCSGIDHRTCEFLESVSPRLFIAIYSCWIGFQLWKLLLDCSDSVL